MGRFLRQFANSRSTPSIDYARVAPWLLIGPALDDVGYTELARRGITHILDLRSEASDDPELMRTLKLAWRRVPIDDQLAPTDEQLQEIIGWLEASGGDRPPVLYAHCQGGLGRSPTVAIALLMSRGFTRAEAHRFVVTARSVAAPTPEQDAWLTTIGVNVAER